MAFYLDTLTKDTGCVRLIPGSHLVGDSYGDAVEAGRSDSEASWGLPGTEVPCVCIESEPGDIVIFNHCLKHASFGGSGRRRMYTMNFCERYPEDRIDGKASTSSECVWTVSWDIALGVFQTSCRC